MSRPWPGRWQRYLAWSSVVAAVALLGPLADARATPLALGEVTTRVSRQGVDLPGAFRSAIVDELRRVDVSDAPSQERVVVSASLVRLDTETQGARARSTCVVSATLRKARGGALVAILQGKARAEDTAREIPSNELTALRAAVHSAVRGIPEAIR